MCTFHIHNSFRLSLVIIRVPTFCLKIRSNVWEGFFTCLLDYSFMRDIIQLQMILNGTFFAYQNLNQISLKLFQSYICILFNMCFFLFERLYAQINHKQLSSFDLIWHNYKFPQQYQLPNYYSYSVLFFKKFQYS